MATLAGENRELTKDVSVDRTTSNSLFLSRLLPLGFLLLRLLSGGLVCVFLALLLRLLAVLFRRFSSFRLFALGSLLALLGSRGWGCCDPLPYGCRLLRAGIRLWRYR